MKKQGFASIYLVYSFFLVFIMVMLTVLMTNNYKKNFLNILKNDIKEDLKSYSIEQITEDNKKSTENPS